MRTIENFNRRVMSCLSVKVFFMWTSSDYPYGAEVHFRDSYGRLILAVRTEKTDDSEDSMTLYTAFKGPALADEKVGETGEPEWTPVTAFCPEFGYVNFDVDFRYRKITYYVSDRYGNILYEAENKTTAANALTTMILYQNVPEGEEEKAGAFTLRDLSIKTRGADVPNLGKSMIAFGDSVVQGHHRIDRSFVNFLAEAEGLKFTNDQKYAINGASVVKHENKPWIMDQFADVKEESPDYIVFDGGINDAYDGVVYGEVRESYDLTNIDETTFAGAFEKLIEQIESHWPSAKWIYVAIAKTNTRDEEIQEKLYQIEMQVCKKWNVTVADLYSLDGIDSLHHPENVEKYAFDAIDEKTGLPVSKCGSATHPNLAAIEEYYVPVVRECMDESDKKKKNDDGKGKKEKKGLFRRAK